MGRGNRAALRAGLRARKPVPVVARLQIIPSFGLFVDEEEVRLPMAVQRVVVFLAVHDRPVLRPFCSGTLWPEGTEAQASANLRSALWRVNRDGYGILDVDGAALRLAPSVDIDLRRLTELARRIAAGAEMSSLDPEAFDRDVLPDWYDDWLVIERERYHQLRLHALEAMSERLTEAGDLANALVAALAAVAGEPLRESAHRALARVHLAEGNRAEAVRQLELYRDLLHEQLNLEPSDQIVELVRSTPG